MVQKITPGSFRGPSPKAAPPKAKTCTIPSFADARQLTGRHSLQPRQGETLYLMSDYAVSLRRVEVFSSCVLSLPLDHVWAIAREFGDAVWLSKSPDHTFSVHSSVSPRYFTVLALNWERNSLQKGIMHAWRS